MSNRTIPTESPRTRCFRRSVALRRLGYDSYRDYLRSAVWADTRRRYRESDLPQDCFCGETEGLHLHHLTYERVGRERLTDLSPLCSRCHRLVHVLERRGDIAIDLVGLASKRRAEREREHGDTARIDERRRTTENPLPEFLRGGWDGTSRFASAFDNNLDCAADGGHRYGADDICIGCGALYGVGPMP